MAGTLQFFRSYMQPTAETVIDFSGDDRDPILAPSKRKRSKSTNREESPSQRDRKKSGRDGRDKDSVVSSSSRKSSSSKTPPREKELMNPEKKERRHKEKEREHRSSRSKFHIIDYFTMRCSLLIFNPP